MIAQFSGTTNKAGNAMGIFFVFAYLAFQGCVLPSLCRLYMLYS
jgi:hypothetical protein